MPRFWDDPRVVTYTPLLTTVITNVGTLGQVWKMWHEGTAKGQNPYSWLLLLIGLLLWMNFYRVCTPQERTAYYTLWISIVVVLIALLTNLHFA